MIHALFTPGRRVDANRMCTAIHAPALCAGGVIARRVAMRNETLIHDVEQCITECAECAIVCAETAHHCLQMGGEHASPGHQGLLQDCKQICNVAAAFMARSSPRSGSLCRLCAEICSECEEECERLARGDSLMTQCTKVCGRCARSCAEMADAM